MSKETLIFGEFPRNSSKVPMPKVKPPKPDEKELPISSRNSLKGVYKATAKRAYAIVRERTPVYHKFTSK
jgi:hypothetical protein